MSNQNLNNMTVFTITIVQGHYDERSEVTLIFSSFEKVQEWLNSYQTPVDSFHQNGREYAYVREVEVDTNELIKVYDTYCLDVESTPAHYSIPVENFEALEGLKAKLASYS